MEARPLWERKTVFICEWLRHGRFDSEVSDFWNDNMVVEGWSPKSA